MLLSAPVSYCFVLCCIERTGHPENEVSAWKNQVYDPAE